MFNFFCHFMIRVQEKFHGQSRYKNDRDDFVTIFVLASDIARSLLAFIRDLLAIVRQFQAIVNSIMLGASKIAENYEGVVALETA